MQKRILIVDDEPAIRDMVAFALRKGEFEPMHAGDAREAQSAIVDRVPDLILLDWMLPGTSGLELARRWRPILDVYGEEGIDLCFELHPGEDLHDGATFERFLAAVDDHPRARILYDPSHLLLQQMDYLGFIDRYHERIGMFHVKDAEFRPDARSGVYGGYQDWAERPGRFRSLGDGQVDFGAIFSKLTQYGFDGWAVLEWECCLKDAAQGAAEGAPFIQRHLIQPATRAFDDFAGSDADPARNRRMLGLE